MGSDIARVSYDPSRKYRSVVMQQGRVFVEADWNEQWEIGNDELRLETLDIVGPAGTPDDGYRIGFPDASAGDPPFDFTIGPGTMYVGGLRVDIGPVRRLVRDDRLEGGTVEVLGGDPTYFNQPEWLRPTAPAPSPPGNEYILLHLTEQEVCAVEDLLIKEVALGGPDTSQRLRLMQRIERYATTGDDCPSALAAMEAEWEKAGLSFDESTMRLTADQRLKVSFTNTATADLCQPAAQGGYLGADNQMIRVKVASETEILWGYDDASFLYRVDVVDAKTLRLHSRPVDAEHLPKSGQAVEILLSEMALDSLDDYVASTDGLVTTLQGDYDPDTQQVKLTDAIGDAAYLDSADPVFLRMWNERIPIKEGTAQELGHTGLQVTLTGPFVSGFYWQFAARPSTPLEVYPPRYIAAPQPPDGPRQWVCPLAVIGWTLDPSKNDTTGTGAVLDDCRLPFDNLVELSKRRGTGCCTVLVRPEQVAGEGALQGIVDKAAAAAERATICFQPGVYRLREPLVLTAKHTDIALEACRAGVILTAAEGAEVKFLHGMIQVLGAANVTIRDIELVLPLVPFREAGGKLGGVEASGFDSVSSSLIRELAVSIGIRPIQALALTVRGCRFRFPTPADGDVLGIGVLGAGRSDSLELTDNVFSANPARLSAGTRPFHVTAGYLLAPTTTLGTFATNNAASSTGSVLPSVLRDATIARNEFVGLTAAAFTAAQTDDVTIEDNRARRCQSGFWLFSLRSLQQMEAAAAADATGASAVERLARQVVRRAAVLPLVQYGAAIARVFPLPPGSGAQSDAVAQDTKKRATARQLQTQVQNVVDRIVGFYTAEGDGAVDATAAAEEAKLTANELQTTVSQFEGAVLSAAAAPAPSSLALTIAGNEVSAVTGTDAAGACALFVFDDAADTRSSLTVSGNKLENSSRSFPTSVIILVERCAAAGNLILNEIDAGGNSLVLFPGGSDPKGPNAAGIAVTGNVFRRPAVLPLRAGVPAPLNDWNVLNTTI